MAIIYVAGRCPRGQLFREATCIYESEPGVAMAFETMEQAADQVAPKIKRWAKHPDGSVTAERGSFIYIIMPLDTDKGELVIVPPVSATRH